MNNWQSPTVYNNQSVEQQEEIQRGFILRVYAWMTLGLIVTAAAAFWTISIPGLLHTIVTTPLQFFGLIMGELVLVIVLTAAVSRMTPAIAGLTFMGYAVLVGVTFSVLTLIYTSTSIALTFGITASTFGIMTLFGYTTHRDLTKLGNLLIMALIGLIIAMVANLFLHNPAIYWVTTFVGILIFIGLVAYDTQKLKKMSLAVSQEGEVAAKASILGALALYLDFINLFLLLLRIFGRRR
jgi:FtsH-binding integral membrane protein